MKELTAQEQFFVSGASIFDTLFQAIESGFKAMFATPKSVEQRNSEINQLGATIQKQFGVKPMGIAFIFANPTDPEYAALIKSSSGYRG